MRRRLAPLIALASALSLATTEARAVDPFEIQVYDGSANAPGQAGLELHLNYVANGLRGADSPELPQHHQAHATLEPSFGVFDWWELGGYFQTALRADGTFDYAGIKLRSKFVRPPENDQDPLRLGANFELSLLPDKYDRNRWGGEVRPILGYEGHGWKLVVNPIVGTPLANPGLGDGPTFEPAATVVRAIADVVDFGLEYYGDIGPIASPDRVSDQAHYVFEVMDVIAWKDVEVNAGVGEGLTDGSNKVVFKLILGWTFDTPLAKKPAAHAWLPARRRLW